MRNFETKFHASSPCKDDCERKFYSGYFGFDKSLGHCSQLELSERCKMRCDDPNIQFGSCTQPSPLPEEYYPPQSDHIGYDLSLID